MDVFIDDCITGMRQHIDSNTIDLVIADPPFGIEFDKVGKSSSYERNGNLVTDGYIEVSSEQYEQFTNDWLKQIYRCLKTTGSAYIFSGWTNLRSVLNSIHDNGFTMVNHIVWRYQFGVFTKRKFSSSHYHVLLVVKDEKRYTFYKEHPNEYIEDVWVFGRPYTKDEERYPTKLPPNVVKKCVKHSSRENDLVLDPFLGSGTTLGVCDDMKRRFVGFEKNVNCIELYKNISTTTTIHRG